MNTAITLLTSAAWSDYALLDSGNSLRLERWDTYIIVRPDPQAIWLPSLPQNEWQKADVLFERTAQDKGKWQYKRDIPEKWLMHWQDVAFWARLTPFKHTGVFPEQSLQWQWIQERIASRESPRILNLFAYTGIASLVAAKAGAQVTHVDASRPSLTWARENQQASGLTQKPIRWILDDVMKFITREAKRGNTYDGIIMDPPVYGHGPTGQIWKFNDHFPFLIKTCVQLLSTKPLFLLVNAYAISSSSLMLANVLESFLPHGTMTVGELALEETESKRLLSTGIFARWSKE